MLRFTPDCVSARASCGLPHRASPLEVSTPLAPDEVARVYCLADEINDQAAALAVASLAAPNRAGIETLHSEIAASPQVEIETRHYFANGLYAREIFVPAGTWVVGAIHGESHINVLSQGDVSVATEAGARRIQAPATFEAVAGRKVIGYTHSDCTWTTFHANPTDERNPDALFKMLTLDEYPDAAALIGSAN